MATLRVYKSYELDLGGKHYHGGSRSDPTEIEVTKASDLYFTVAASTTVSIWNGTTDELAEFDYLWIESDQDLRLELTVDVGNEVGDELWARIILAGEPFDLLHDDALAGYTAAFVGGTADVLDRLKVRNAGSTTANVSIFMAT